MEFHAHEIDNDVMILTADGGLNSDTAEEFVLSIERLVETGLTKLIIDCSKLTFISSYGLGVLIRLHKRMKTRGGDVKLAGLRGLVPQAISVTRLDGIFQLYPDVDRARLAFRPPSDVAE